MESVYQGNTTQLTAEFEDAVGVPTDPINPRGQILDSLGGIVVPETPLSRVTQGIYFMIWSVPGGLDPGFYYMIFKGTVEGVEVDGVETIQVLAQPITPSSPSPASEYCNVSCVKETILRIKKNADPDLTYDVFRSFIQRASAQINGRLRKYYKVPFTTVPEIVSEICCNISAVLILRRWYITNTPEESQAAKNIMDEMSTLLDGFMDAQPKYFLDDVYFRDDVGIGTDGTIVFTTINPASIKIGNLGYNPTFDMGPTVDQTVDPNYLEDLRTLKSELWII